MDDDTVHLSDSDEAKAAVSRLLKSIEGWASKESQKGEAELTAFAAALASGIISFHEFTSKDCRNSRNLIGAVARVKQHLEKEHKKFDSEIDKMHIKFAQEMEELDLKIIRDRKEFKHYLISLIYAEEYNKLKTSITNIYETLDAKANYGDTGSTGPADTSPDRRAPAPAPAPAPVAPAPAPAPAPVAPAPAPVPVAPAPAPAPVVAPAPAPAPPTDNLS